MTKTMKTVTKAQNVLGSSARIEAVGGAPVVRIVMVYNGKVSDNSRYSRNRWGRPVLRSAVKTWMEQLGWTARVWIQASGISFHLPILVTFQLEFPSRQHLPDVHNFHKAVCDALKKDIGVDDVHYLTRDLEERIVPGTAKKLIITLSEAGKV